MGGKSVWMLGEGGQRGRGSTDCRFCKKTIRLKTYDYGVREYDAEKHSWKQQMCEVITMAEWKASDQFLF